MSYQRPAADRTACSPPARTAPDRPDRVRALLADVEAACEATGAPSPGEFLARAMAGEDPRPLDGELFMLVKRIAFREFDPAGGEPYPTREEWDRIIEIVIGSGLYNVDRVSFRDSMRAAENLMEFLHAKMKAIELSGSVGVDLTIHPLTDDEVKTFAQWYNDRY